MCPQEVGGRDGAVVRRDGRGQPEWNRAGDAVATSTAMCVRTRSASDMPCGRRRANRVICRQSVRRDCVVNGRPHRCFHRFVSARACIRRARLSFRRGVAKSVRWRRGTSPCVRCGGAGLRAIDTIMCARSGVTTRLSTDVSRETTKRRRSRSPRTACLSLFSASLSLATKRASAPADWTDACTVVDTNEFSPGVHRSPAFGDASRSPRLRCVRYRCVPLVERLRRP